MNSERTVLVTGFGPFKNHEVNASWEAVKELHTLRDTLKERYNVHLVIYEIQVDYDHVLDRVPKLWEKHEPQLVLHVGVSHLAKCLTIERYARGNGYERKDINERCPQSAKCEKSPSTLETNLDIEELCRKLNDKSNGDCKACISHDAGRYLCEFIYYQSLDVNPDRTIFVHVPDFKVYSSALTAKGLYDIIEFFVQ